MRLLITDPLFDFNYQKISGDSQKIKKLSISNPWSFFFLFLKILGVKNEPPPEPPVPLEPSALYLMTKSFKNTQKNSRAGFLIVLLPFGSRQRVYPISLYHFFLVFVFVFFTLTS